MKINLEKYKKYLNAYTILFFCVLLLYSISLLLPMVWAFISSVKTRRDFSVEPFNLPNTWEWKNYKVAFFHFFVEYRNDEGTLIKTYMDQMMVNSFLYAGTCAFISTFVACIMAYMTSKYTYKFSKILYTVVIICMIIPIVGSLPSELQMAKNLGLFGHLYGMWAMKATFLGMYFLVFYAIFKQIPWDYAESAFVDGASHYRVMFQIMLPMAKTTFLTVFLLYFIQYWNDYQTPLIFMPHFPTASYGMFVYQNSYVNEINSIPMQLAGSMIVTLPILAIFLLFKNRLMGNLTMGGLKG